MKHHTAEKHLIGIRILLVLLMLLALCLACVTGDFLRRCFTLFGTDVFTTHSFSETGYAGWRLSMEITNMTLSPHDLSGERSRVHKDGSRIFYQIPPRVGSSQYFFRFLEKDGPVIYTTWRNPDYQSVEHLIETTGGCFYQYDSATDTVQTNTANMQTFIPDFSYVHSAFYADTESEYFFYIFWAPEGDAMTLYYTFRQWGVWLMLFLFVDLYALLFFMQRFARITAPAFYRRPVIRKAHWALVISCCFGLLLLINGNEILRGSIWFLGIPLIWIVDVAALLLLLWGVFGYFSLENRITDVARGETPKEKLPPWPFALAGQELSRIREGAEAAAARQIQDERMKTELIANVSHDLKTPLTSIINYTAMVKKKLPEGSGCESYVEILERKSLELKSLTEDLLELSRLSSGNETVNCEPLDFGEMVRQANGEYGEAMDAKKLTLKSSLPNGPLMVYTDGKKLWRVLENLYGNMVKYAMEGTRVFVDVTQKEEQIAFSLRNISAMELNVTPEELMERFVRGDDSRHSEGNGLGLSIAKQLTELLGGQFSIDIQGDLFTASFVIPAPPFPAEGAPCPPSQGRDQ